MTQLIDAHAVTDDVLARFDTFLGPDAQRYRNHVYRCLNYQRILLQLNVIPDDVALAWALHDIGVWTTGWDYIEPSLQYVDELASAYGVDNVERARQMVEWHHKLRPCEDRWTETFRVADRIDVSRGLIRSGVPRTDIAQVVQAFPYLGFQALLVRTAASWTLKHPLHPMPMLRW